MFGHSSSISVFVFIPGKDWCNGLGGKEKGKKSDHLPLELDSAIIRTMWGHWAVTPLLGLHFAAQLNKFIHSPPYKPNPSQAFLRKMNPLKRKSESSNRIMVSIGNGAPPASSTLLSSDSVQIGGLQWRLQISFMRNPIFGNVRFLSLHVLCEDLGPDESITALVNFRLLSQFEGYSGKQHEIIARFNPSQTKAGVSNFIEYSQIFAPDSEFISEQLNEAQIEARIRIKNRASVGSPKTAENCVAQSGKNAMEDGRKNGGNEEESFDNYCEAELEENLHLNQLEWMQISGGSSMEQTDSEENTEEEESMESGMEDESATKRAPSSLRMTKITDYFPLRRSCRVSHRYLKSFRLQVLTEQVKLAMHEPFLDIFMSPIKGRGLQTRKSFAKHEFVVEYKGDVLNFKRAKRREKRYELNPKIGCYMFYFKHNDHKWCIDATKETGDKGRLVNHSRLRPNMKAKVFDLGNKHPHLCLVALRDISAGEELTFDYGDRTPLTVSKNPWLLNT